MKKQEAIEWLKGGRSSVNTMPQDPLETWQLRTAQTDAAMVMRAYWTLKAYHEGIIRDDESSNNI